MTYSNNLHKSLCLMADPDLTFHSRMVFFLTEPLAADHSDSTIGIRSPTSTRAWHIGWSRWSWLAPLCQSIEVMSDMTLLRRMGFVTQFPSAIYAGMVEGDPLVLVQDTMAASAMKFLVQLLRTRSSSMLWYTSCFPGCLAPLLDEDPAVVLETMTAFREAVTAWEAAKTCAQADVQELADRCHMTGKYMTACIRLAKDAGWTVSMPLRELLNCVFTAMLNEKLNEDANHKIRDIETRANASKTMQHFTQWSVPVERKILELYERPPMAIDVSVPCMRDTGSVSRHSLFEPVFEEGKRDKELVDFAGILHPKTWSTYNSITLKESAVVMELVRFIHRKGDWGLLDKVWVTTLLPKGHVVVDMELKSFYLVLDVWKTGALAWPLQGMPGKRFVLSTRMKKLPFLFVFDEDKFRIVPTSCRSPLRSKLLGDNRALQLSLDVVGDPMTLREFAASVAYQHVPEVTREFLIHECFPKEVATKLVESPEGQVMALMRHTLPDLSPLQAEEAMRRASACQICCESGLGDVDMTMVMDVAILGDQGSILKSVQDNEKLQKKLVVKLADAMTVVKAHFKSKPPSASAKAFDKQLLSLVQSKTKLPATRDRWFASADKNAIQHLETWKPASARVCVDDPNGRYLCNYPGTDRKSFSWSKRGQQKAVVEVLRWFWAEHSKATGIECPFPADFLEMDV